MCRKRWCGSRATQTGTGAAHTQMLPDSSLKGEKRAAYKEPQWSKCRTKNAVWAKLPQQCITLGKCLNVAFNLASLGEGGSKWAMHWFTFRRVYLKNSGLGGRLYTFIIFLKMKTLNFAAKKGRNVKCLGGDLNVDFMQDFYLHGFECHGSFNGLVLKHCSADKILCFQVHIFLFSLKCFWKCFL